MLSIAFDWARMIWSEVTAALESIAEIAPEEGEPLRGGVSCVFFCQIPQAAFKLSQPFVRIAMELWYPGQAVPLFPGMKILQFIWHIRC